MTVLCSSRSFPVRRAVEMLAAVVMVSCSWVSTLHLCADEKPIPSAAPQDSAAPRMVVRSCDDFTITGVGDAAAWQKAEWVPLNARPKQHHDYSARIKMLYSKTGVYVLFDGTDAVLTSTLTEDFTNLWTEDVYECFFWPNTEHPVYFEYEISPMGFELPILVPKLNGKFMGWRPWNYEGARRIQKKSTVTGGEQKSMATVSGWRAEVFIPYELLKPLTQVPPQSGTEWKANFYRVDYDNKQSSSWDWARVGPSFHEIEKFGTLVFE